MTNRGGKKSSGRVRHLQPVTDPPIEVEVAFDLDPVELIEPIYAMLARDVGRSRHPLDVECGIAEWLAMTTQMVSDGVPAGEQDGAVAAFLVTLIEVAARHADSQALALLRALSMLPGTPSAELADAAAAELAASGIADRAWVAGAGQLRPTTCLRYGHVDGSQESLIVGFSYGRREHAIAVLIDHDLGGGLKDCWITDQPETIRTQLLSALTSDHAVEVGWIDPTRAEQILSAALSRPVCAATEDQISDVGTNLPLLLRRIGVLSGRSWQPAGHVHHAPTSPRNPANQDPLFADATSTPGEPSAPAALVHLRPHAEVTKAKEPAVRSRSSAAVLQLKVTLAASKPPIWRRLTVPESITLERLHQVIQVAFGWTNSHLRVFEIGDAEYGSGGEWAEYRSEKTRLSRLVAVGDRFMYVYDLGDNWRHAIQVEKRLPAGTGGAKPACTGGRRAAPPEDCGGVWGYQALLDAIADPERADPGHLSWAADALALSEATLPAYDPAHFDPAEVNTELAKLRP